MKTTNTLAAALIAVVLMFSITMAEVPSMINYQGYLTNSSGQPLSGPHYMTFTIYDAPAPPEGAPDTQAAPDQQPAPDQAVAEKPAPDQAVAEKPAPDQAAEKPAAGACPSCGGAVQAGWFICPSCKNPLS